MARFSGVIAFILWALACLTWFDAGVPFRPVALGMLPPALLAVPALVFFIVWLRDTWPVLVGPTPGPAGALALALVSAFLLRLPMAWWGASGYLTSDGALSGIMAVHIRDGIDHLVFIPNSGYSGSLKAHLTVLLAVFADMPRAFALSSLLFYLLFVAAIYRLGALADPEGRTALLAGLYAAFAPAWVTHYSLSNDGNYVEVLAFGSWALFLTARWIQETADRPLRAVGIGLLLGLGFWCHVLAILYGAAIFVLLVALGRRRLLPSLPSLALGFIAGYFPGLLWNAGNGWFSLGYLFTGAHQDRPVDPTSFISRILPMVTDHWPILLGYDSWYPPVLDASSHGLAWVAVAATIASIAIAIKAARRRPAGVMTVLLVFTFTNLGLALIGSEHIAGNPRYLLFLMTPIPVLLAAAFGRGWGRGLLGVLIAFGAVGSFATFLPNAATDARWRSFVAHLETEGVRWCHTDFYLAAKINFLSEERVVCSSRLGPTYSDYFHYADRVGAAPAADLIPINRTRAAKIAARLKTLGVTYERRDLMKPVLLRLSRRVDPDELLGDPQPLPGSTLP